MNRTEALALWQRILEGHVDLGRHIAGLDAYLREQPAPVDPPTSPGQPPIEPDPGGEDWRCYLAAYKDVRNVAKERNLDDDEARAWAEQHYNHWGRAEGRTWGCDVTPPQGDGQVGERVEIGAGFVFKPVSEGDHKLVVLLPASFDEHTAVTIEGEPGRSVGRTNGNRPTYRFSRPGGHYPSPAAFTIGEHRYYVVQPDRRHEGALWQHLA